MTIIEISKQRINEWRDSRSLRQYDQNTKQGHDQQNWREPKFLTRPKKSE
jgi:hypothetical protein